MRIPQLLLIGVATVAPPLLANDKADRVFLNGNIWTGDAARPRAEALAVRGPRILAVGKTGEIRRRAEKHTDVVDLRGAFVVPGLIDARQHLLSGSLPKELALEERLVALRKGLAVAASLGLTGVHDGRGTEEDLALLERLERDGMLTLRVDTALEMLKTPTADQLAVQASIRAAHQTSRVRVTAVRGVVDGRISGRAAWLFEPYTGGGNGVPAWSALELEQTVAAYDREGWQVQIQANGDRAVAAALDAFEKAARTNGSRGRRHRIEGVELVRPADLLRMKALDVVASTQPLATEGDRVPREGLLGAGRDERVNAFRLFDDAGVTQAFGTGWPAFTSDLFVAIAAAAARRPSGDASALGVEAVLRHFTQGPAYASRGDGSLGVLKTGSMGDFAVLSASLLDIPLADIPKTRVLRTVVAGNDVYVAR